MVLLLNKLLLLAALLVSTAFSYQQLVVHKGTPALDSNQEQEALYLPSGEGLELISFGFKNALSDLLWFKAISYFGKHYKSDRNYTWLSHMCDLITTLDSRASHVYEFCSLMLAWEAEKVDSAMALLNKGIKNDSSYWRYYYLRGINYTFFLHDDALAQEDFISGAKLPSAPPFMAGLAAKKLALNDPQTALEFLRNMIASSKDENQRKVLTKRYNKALKQFRSAATKDLSNNQTAKP